MRTFVIAVTLCTLPAIAMGCSGAEKDETQEEEGGEGEACYPNGTCDAGLDCRSERCVMLDPMFGSGGNGSGGSGSGGTQQYPDIGPDAACQGLCGRYTACGIGQDNCVQGCLNRMHLQTGSCMDLLVQNSQCVTLLTCGPLDSYFDGQRAHETCGATYSVFFNECASTGGVVLPECTSFCSSFAACNLENLAPIARCEENCMEALAQRSLRGEKEACIEADRTFHACYARASCAELDEANEFGYVPDECMTEFDQMYSLCNE